MIACHPCPEAADIQDQPTSLRVEVGGKVGMKSPMLADCSNLTLSHESDEGHSACRDDQCGYIFKGSTNQMEYIDNGGGQTSLFTNS